MAWNERITEAAITTPDGERYVFQYRDVEYSAAKKQVSINFQKLKVQKYRISDLASVIFH